MSQDRPDEDKDIVNDPKWHEVVEYAKKAYIVLTSSVEPTV